MLRKIIPILLACCLAIISQAQTFNTSVRQVMNDWQKDEKFKHASVGVAISDAKSSELIYQSEPQLSLVPASLLKIVTTATALELLGPDFHFQTILANFGVIRNDTLVGNLEIIGGGDPTLGSHYFPENELFLNKWVEVLKVKNIKVIQGNLVLDDHLFEKQIVPDTWVWEDIGNYYGALASGLSFFDNLFEIHFSSANVAGLPARIIKISPEIKDLEIQNEVLSSDTNGDQTCVYGSLSDTKRIIRGTIPKKQSDFIIKASVPDPAVLLAHEFRKKLNEAGIIITGANKFEKAVAEITPLVVQKSPALRDIIRVTNYESVNLFAEHLLKYLAYQKEGLGTTDAGCRIVEQFWKEKGFDTNGFFMNDGSGLSRFNAITAVQLLAILNYMRTQSRYAAYFYPSLPTAGNGTLSNISFQEFPNLSLRAKSGSMTRVRCYGGYLTCVSGRQLAFVVMLNNFSCSQAEAIKKTEEVLTELRKL